MASATNSTLRLQLLRQALPLVPSHGFSRQALASAALSLQSDQTLRKPLSDTALSALFGSGDSARMTLINFWLEEGRHEMGSAKEYSIGSLLKHRLKWNEPVLSHLSEAFTLMSTPTPGPPVDPRHALRHAASIADEACYLSGNDSSGTSWYARRASLGALYLAAELHQLSSPSTAADFLDDILKNTEALETMLSDTVQFSQFIGRSWIGITRSLGLV